MDISIHTQAVIIGLVIGMATSVIKTIATFLGLALFRSIYIDETPHAAALDKLITTRGVCSTRMAGAGQPPAEGIHLGWADGPFVAIKMNSGGQIVYWVYAAQTRTIDAVRAEIIGNSRNIYVRYIYSRSVGDVSVSTALYAPISEAYDWQCRVIGDILKIYETSTRATALVCGPMGIGKSMLGEFIAMAMKTTQGSDPIVIKNCDFTTRGLVFEDIVRRPDANTPYILVIDEFDVAITHAERPASEASPAVASFCHAENPSSLLSILDRINRVPYLIAVATTNKTLAEMTSGVCARYTRAGRFNLHFEEAREKRE